jgi:tetratricopeptide (TPR) repeat protein
MTDALELRRLAAEGFPASADAAYRLGLSESDAGQAAEAREAFTRALKLLESSAMPEERREAMRKEIRSCLCGTQ